MAKKIYVLDTSVILASSNAIYSFQKEDIVIPLKVLEEVDKHKNRQDSVGQNARGFIKILDSLRETGSLQNGVKVQKGKGLLRTAAFDKNIKLPADLDMSVPDHVIMATALSVKLHETDKKVIMVSRDINMRVIADAIGLTSEAYDANAVVNDSSELYSGVSEMLVDDEFIDKLFSGVPLGFDDETSSKLFPNQFITLISEANASRTALVRYLSFDKPLRKLPEYKGNRNKIFGIEAKNREQSFALDLLMDPDVPVVSLVGSAGSGKTLISVAAGMEQVLTTGQYTRLIVSRPVQPMGKDLGYLPGPQPLTSKVLTPTGWTTMGDIKIGDLVISRDGKPTKVLGVYPKGKKKVVKITTTDEQTTECCEDHLWLTRTSEDKKRSRAGTVKTTREIIDTFKNKKNKINHFIPRNEPVQYERVALPLAPYTLGVLLGDGCIVDSVNVSNTDLELINRVSDEVSPLGCRLVNSGKDIIYNIRSDLYNNKPARNVKITNIESGNEQIFSSIGTALHFLRNIDRSTLGARCEKKLTIDRMKYEFLPCEVRWQNPVKNVLDGLGLLKHHAWEKFIPQLYIYSSVEDRISLLQGLMDTDGTIKKNGEASFTTTSPRLASDIRELVQSLGGRAIVRSRGIRNNKKAQIGKRDIISKREAFEFNISLPEDINPFYISRKSMRHSCEYIHSVGIKSIELLEEEKEVQCIMVENPEHLYITDDFIVTHNTIEEKMLPWLAPIQDNLQSLLGNDAATLKEYIDKGTIEMEALTYIRGRSIAKAFMIVDEAQNLTAHELKTIATRIGEGTKLVLTGDIEQIDNMYVNDTSNGLAHAVEKFKPYELAGHVSLVKGERSAVATLAAKIL